MFHCGDEAYREFIHSYIIGAIEVTLPRLNNLAELNGAASPPGYVPNNHKAGIVHLGIGAFHRAHQAVMTDDALAARSGDWRIIGVSLRSHMLAEKLNEQNGLFTLIERGARRDHARVIGSIERVIAANPEATLVALCDPAICIVTLTVTEKGYGIDRETGLPDTANAAVAADIKSPETPSGVLGLLVAALRQRRAKKAPPLTLLSCDNLPENGRLLRSGVVGFARMCGESDLAQWIDTHIAFPSSMVDRITPASTDKTLADAKALTGREDRAAVETEPFIQWVIEDNFASGRPYWEAGGALFVPDVTPYERMKLTVLNGGHSMLAYSGFLSGCEYVRDVMSDPDLSGLVRRHLKAAAALQPPLDGVDFDIYTSELIERFANPAIAHETNQIATDGTQKLSQRIFQPAIQALDLEHDVRPFAFAAAMWMRFCLRRHDDGHTYELRDPRADELIEKLAGVELEASKISNAIHSLQQLVPARLASDSTWRSAIEEVLEKTLREGCRASVVSEAVSAKDM